MKTPKADKQREEDSKWIAGILKERNNNLLKAIEKDLIAKSKLIKCKEIHFGQLHIVYIRDCLKVLDKYKET